MSAMEPKPMLTPDLGGLLSRPRRPKSRPDPADTSPVHEEKVSTQPETQELSTPVPSVDLSTIRATQAAPAVRTAQPSATTASSSTYGRNVTLYMPATVHRAVLAALDESQMSLTGFILSAVNKNHGRLGEWLERDGRQAGDLFTITQTTVKPGPTARTTIRVTEEQLAAIDSLAESFAVPRTQVLVAALRAELGIRKTTQQ